MTTNADAHFLKPATNHSLIKIKKINFIMCHRIFFQHMVSDSEYAINIIQSQMFNLAYITTITVR